MKNQNVLLAAALLVLGAASCQKEEEVVTQFTAGMEQSSDKTYLGDDSYFYWESTDAVKVYSDASNAGSDFTVAPRSDNGTWAVLSGSITAGGSYTAIYPAGIAASASSVTLPAEQTSADGSLAGFPMYAVSSTNEFQFKNLCGALRIHLEQANCTISSIKVTAASAINGIYDIYDTTGIPMLAHHDGSGTNTVTLTLGTAQPIGEGHDFYVQLPAGEYSGMQLTFYQPDGSCCTKSGSVTVERSVCTPVEITNGLAFAPAGPANNQIWYTTGSGGAISKPRWSGYSVSSNIYQDGRGVITFADPVAALPEGAFQDNGDLTSVTLSASVTSIGESAFSSCSSLASVTLPGVTRIGDNAFGYCGSLASVTLPGVTRIGSSAFQYCSSLTSVALPSVTHIGDWAFISCGSLATLTLSGSVTSIGSYVFENCDNLNTICWPVSTAPDWLQDYTFAGKAYGGTLHVFTGANTNTRYWPGFDIWTIVADL